MARRRKGLPVHGWLVLDKPEGMTSSQAVGKLRHLFDAAKAGHAGTLDPLATGVLPIGFGEATKTMPFVVDSSKAYRFTIRFGAQTDTDDAEGRIIERSAHLPSQAEIEAALPRFSGEIEQLPPRYSALKVDGARAYDLAREEVEFELAPRKVTVGSLRLLDMPDAEHAVLETECGKGTYIRSIARDLARAVGSLGHIAVLRRTRVGPFPENAAISLAKLMELGHSAAGREALLGLLKPLETALDDIPALAVSSDDAARLRRGQSVLIRGRDAPIVEGPVYATTRGELVAVGEMNQGEMCPKRVFNLQG